MMKKTLFIVMAMCVSTIAKADEKVSMFNPIHTAKIKSDITLL